MKITILHDQIPPDARPDEADTLVQARVVEAALRRLGHQPSLLPFVLDFAEMQRVLRAADEADLVFNLVEAPGGNGRLIHMVPSLLELGGVPFTGAPSEGVYLTSNKLLAKRALHAAGVRTPPWLEAHGPADPGGYAGPHIIKSVWEHASLGLDDDSIVEATSADDLRSKMAARSPRLGGEAFAERFIAGREFNLSVLGGPEGPEVLPPAEIDFAGFGPERVKIVGYKAKWTEGSFEYANTPRRFEFAEADRPLLEKMTLMAIRCWQMFQLRGYARVDFRVDESGRPWVLEVNTNPCLSPDAGFAAAVEQAGIGFDAAVARIVADTGVASADGAAHRASPREQRDAPSTSGTATSAGTPAQSGAAPPEAFRTRVRTEDARAVREIVSSSGFFSEAEIGVAVELVEEHLAKGEASGYLFVLVEEGGRTVGYACYGPIACTTASYDLYWIAVHADHRGHGLGRILAREVERLIAARGGTRVYAETSSREQYAPTRAFYERCGYVRDAEMRDFYAPDDGKVVYVRVL